MKFNKDDIYGLTGSILFHGVILLILWLCVLKPAVPEEDGGVLVNFGNVDIAAGTFEPKYTGENVATNEPAPTAEEIPQQETAPQEMLTQDIEESVALEEKKKKQQEEEKKKQQEAELKRKQEQEEKERLQREEAERKRREEEQRKKEQAINNKIAGAFGIGKKQGSNQGSGNNDISGNQGSPLGNADMGENEGVGGIGSWDLKGRSLSTGHLPRPAYTNQEEGQIVINITVDPDGNVIFAEIGKGTDIGNASMRKSAIDAAKKAKFNKISSANNQSGTITYKYVLK